MAIFHVISTGSNTSPYETWAKAAPDLSVVDSVVAGGDTIFVDSAHAKDYGAATTTLNFSGGSPISPIKIVSVISGGTDGANDAYAAGASERVTGAAFDLLVSDSIVMWGISFISDNKIKIGTSSQAAEWHECSLNCDILEFPSNATSGFRNRLFDCTITFNDILNFLSQENIVEFHSCTFVRNETALKDVFVFGPGADAINVLLENCDLSNVNLDQYFDIGGNNQKVVVRRCKLNASATLLNSDITDVGSSLFVEYSESGNPADISEGLQLYADRFGRVTSDTASFFTTGGANDGVRNYSWKMVSTTHCIEKFAALKTPQFGAYVTGGAAVTVTVRVASNVTLQNDECWIELSGPRATTFTAQGLWRTTRSGASNSVPCGNPQTTPANLTAGAGGEWTGGAEVGTEQEISYTWTPAENGPVMVRLALAKPSQTMFVDPKIEVT